MIEIQLRDVVNGIEALNEISKKSLKARPAFALARILRELDKEVTLFQKNRQQLIEKYGEKDEEGKLAINDEGNYTILTNEIDNFNEELNELLDTIIQLNADPIGLNDIEDIDFTVQQMNILSLFVKE